MNTLYFQYVLEIDRTRSITQAADNLFLAQPNLSKTIHELEDQIGFPIFTRTSKGVTPTEKGARFIEHARQIVAQLSKIDALGHSDAVETTKLRLAMPRSAYIAEGVADFLAEDLLPDGSQVHWFETHAIEAIRKVSSGECAFGIIRYRLDCERYFLDYLREKELNSELLWEYDRVVVLSEQNPLAGVNQITEEELRSSIEIVYGDNMIPYISDDRSMLHRESRMHICVYDRGQSLELLSRLPGAYILSAPLPAAQLSRDHLVQKPCDIEGKRCRDMIISRKDPGYTAFERRLIDRIFEARNRLVFHEN